MLICWLNSFSSLIFTQTACRAQTTSHCHNKLKSHLFRDTLNVKRTVIPAATTLPTYSLSAGWDLVGFNRQPLVTNERIGFHLSSIAGNYQLNSVWVYTNEGASWIRVDSSNMLNPGQAMWILLTAPTTLKPQSEPATVNTNRYADDYRRHSTAITSRRSSMGA